MTPTIDHPAAASAAIDASVSATVAQERIDEGRSPTSPEARKQAAVRAREERVRHGLAAEVERRVGPGTRFFAVLKRVAIGTFFDGFIHAGNLAYLSLIALFPFFITATALMSGFGRTADGIRALEVVLATMPQAVASVIDAPVREVLNARTGPFLWLGGLVGLWTVGSLIETIRDILRRAYGTRARKSFWKYRLYSIGIIVGAVLLLLVSFSLQVVTVGAEQVITRFLPGEVGAVGVLALSRGISGGGLFLSLYLLFYSLTPHSYRHRRYPKWPGAAATSLWWIAVTLALPPLLASILRYNATYGSLAGVMVTLFFFYLIGLGVVIGAELNAALAETPEEALNRIGQADDRARTVAQAVTKPVEPGE